MHVYLPWWCLMTCHSAGILFHPTVFLAFSKEQCVSYIRYQLTAWQETDNEWPDRPRWVGDPRDNMSKPGRYWRGTICAEYRTRGLPCAHFQKMRMLYVPIYTLHLWLQHYYACRAREILTPNTRWCRTFFVFLSKSSSWTLDCKPTGIHPGCATFISTAAGQCTWDWQVLHGLYVLSTGAAESSLRLEGAVRSDAKTYGTLILNSETQVSWRQSNLIEKSKGPVFMSSKGRFNMFHF